MKALNSVCLHYIAIILVASMCHLYPACLDMVAYLFCQHIMVLILFFRYETNDTELLDECSFFDPRVKSLVHLSKEKQESVKTRVLAWLQVDEEMSHGEQSTSDEPDPMDNVSAQDSGLLSSILSGYATTSHVERTRSDVELEVQRYLSEKACPMQEYPLLW